jgi:enoyl-CoA hydratase/carnithine racemase
VSERIVISSNDGVVDVRLNRPDKLNALDLGMYEALVDASEAIKTDLSARVVVLSGVGRAFCAGLDRRLLLSSARDEAVQEGSRPHRRPSRSPHPPCPTGRLGMA